MKAIIKETPKHLKGEIVNINVNGISTDIEIGKETDLPEDKVRILEDAGYVVEKIDVETKEGY